MHKHSADEDRDTLRPKAAKLEEDLPDHYGRAAVAGRTDVLGTEGLLGLQRVAGNSGVSSMLEEERSPVHDVVNSSGRPLDPSVRTDMEQRLGQDFSDVRVHDDSAAAASAQAVNAHAYTVGSNIVFQRDKYDPTSAEGRTTLAHELTHVVQQRNGPVDGTSAPGGIKVSDPSDRFEREAAATAERALSAPTGPAAPDTAAAPAVQRHEAGPDEEPVQGLFVQRQATEEEEEPVQGLFVQRQEGEEEEEETPAT
jgi:hypothetical protein